MERRKLLQQVSVVGILAVAGCSGVNDDASSPTKTATTTEPVDVPEEQVIDYDDLSSTQQEAFEQARNETVRFSTGVPGLEKPIHYGLGVFEPFRNHEYVRKNDTYYELSTGRSGFISGKRVAVEQVDTVDDESVIQLDNKTDEGIDLIKEAIESDGDAAKIQVEMPDSITVDAIVEYQDEYYRITQLSTRDYEYFTLTVKQYS